MILAILIPLLVVGLVWLMYTGAAPEGSVPVQPGVPTGGSTATR